MKDFKLPFAKKEEPQISEMPILLSYRDGINDACIEFEKVAKEMYKLANESDESGKFQYLLGAYKIQEAISKIKLPLKQTHE